MNATEPALRTSGRIHRTATAAAPTVDDDGGALQVGTELVRDTGGRAFWDGTKWKGASVEQQLGQIADLLIEIRDLLTDKG
jgi:hypothetical protein